MNEAVSGVITLWRDGIPFWFDIYADPICSILKGKMLLVGLDDVIPDHLYGCRRLAVEWEPRDVPNHPEGNPDGQPRRR